MSPHVISVGELRGFKTKEEPRQPTPQVLPESKAAIQVLRKLYPFQSFHSADFQRALLAQQQNQPIVQSTLDEYTGSGYAVGLSPMSQTPVAIAFSGTGSQAGSATYILKPGMTVRPVGSVPGGVSFASFKYGLPFGWLGGGAAFLFVHKTPDADTGKWNADNELLFHRLRLPIFDPPTAGNALTWASNWPTRFPWPLAVRVAGASSIPQGGQAQLALARPGRVLMRLRAPAGLGAPATMRIAFQRSTDFDAEYAGAGNLPVAFEDFDWPAFTPVLGAGFDEFPALDVGAVIRRLGGDEEGAPPTGIGATGIRLIDLTGTLAGLEVDVLRYGYF